MIYYTDSMGTITTWSDHRQLKSDDELCWFIKIYRTICYVKCIILLIKEIKKKITILQ